MFDEEDIALFGTPLECNDKVTNTVTAKRYLHFVFDIRAVADTRQTSYAAFLVGSRNGSMNHYTHLSGRNWLSDKLDHFLCPVQS